MVSFMFVAFCAFSVILLTAALGVVLSRNPVHASLFLVVAFLASAGVWMLLEAEFLSLLIVLVYVGAVMVLFLFVIMMLDINLDVLREGFWRYLPLAVLAAFFVVGEISFVVLYGEPLVEAGRYPPPPPENVRAIASLLYTDYAYVLELAAILLLVAIVAAVALTLRKRKGLKYTDPALQVRANPEGRVHMAAMPAAVSGFAAESESTAKKGEQHEQK